MRCPQNAPAFSGIPTSYSACRPSHKGIAGKSKKVVGLISETARSSCGFRVGPGVQDLSFCSGLSCRFAASMHFSADWPDPTCGFAPRILLQEPYHCLGPNSESLTSPLVLSQTPGAGAGALADACHILEMAYEVRVKCLKVCGGETWAM